MDNVRYLESTEESDVQDKYKSIVYNYSKRALYNFGYRVGLSPISFIVCSILASIACMAGLHKLRIENDLEYILTSRESQAKVDRSRLEALFPIDYNSTFEPSRVSRLQAVHLLVLAKDEETMLKEEIWKDVVALENAILEISVDFNEHHFTYEDLCARLNERCIQSPLSILGQHMPMIQNRSMWLQYPKSSLPNLYSSFWGGVELNETEGLLLSAKAIALNFWLKRDNAETNIG